MDGILGLALTEANAQGVPTVMDQLVDLHCRVANLRNLII
jgi:hypothetical protein